MRPPITAGSQMAEYPAGFVPKRTLGREPVLRPTWFKDGTLAGKTTAAHCTQAQCPGQQTSRVHGRAWHSANTV